MSAGSWTVRAGTALSLASLALTVDNLRRLRTPDPAAEPVSGECVAVLLPVRDEAAVVVECVRALARAVRHHGSARLVVLDDASVDGTAGLLRRLAEEDPLVEVVAGTPAPPGWLGKPWACRQLADAVPEADVLVFVDADTTLAEHAVTATAALLRSSGLDLVCPYPRQVAVSPAERLVQPLLQWSWLSTLPLGLAERSPRPSLVAANGQLLAVDARAYRRAGGHGAVRRDVLEDIALLRAVKAGGGRGVVADGTHLATTRMYDGWPALRAGYGKSLWSAFGSPAGALATQGVLLLAHVVPALAALTGSRTGAVGYAASVTSRALAARRTGSPVADSALHPVSVLLLAGLTADSFRGRRRGTLRWKGRPVEVS